MVVSVFPVAIAQLIVKWESTSAHMPKKVRTLSELRVWVVAFVRLFAHVECFDSKTPPMTRDNVQKKSAQRFFQLIRLELLNEVIVGLRTL